MTDWAKAMNPTSPLNAEADALAAARASAIAIFLGVIWGIVGVVYMMTAGREMMEAAVTAASTPETAGMAGMMAQAAMWMAVGMVVIQLILGLVQWFKPNIVIPIIFVILVAFGLVSGIWGLMMANNPDLPAAAQTPMWQVAAGFAVMAVELVLHIAGIRGASALDRLRMQAAQEY